MDRKERGVTCKFFHRPWIIEQRNEKNILTSVPIILIIYESMKPLKMTLITVLI